MITVYVASAAPMAGKTMFCAGLGLRLVAEGRRVGYFRQISSRADQTGQESDGAFMAEILGLEEDIAVLASRLPAEEAAVRQALPTAVAQAAEGKEIMLVEESRAWPLIPSAPHEPARILGAKSVLLVRYSVDLGVERVLAEAQGLGDTLAGVVINAVPPARLPMLQESLVPRLEEAGLRVFGILPEERSLLALPFAALAAHLGAEYIVGEAPTDGLVESIMVGPMSADPATAYFAQRPHKAVVTRLGRPDLQLGALSSPTSGLILTGRGLLGSIVRLRAEQTNTPVVSVSQDTNTTLGNLDGVWTGRRIREPGKARTIRELLSQNLNFNALYQGLGLSSE